MATQMRALDTFFVGNRIVEVGDVLPSDDLLVKKNAALFERVVPQKTTPVVEQATAAPGEKRTTRSRKTK